MNHYKFLIFLFFLFKGFCVFGQSDFNVEVRFTDELRKENEVSFATPRLTLDDFKSPPDRTSKWAAMTYCGIRLEINSKQENGVYFYDVLVYPYMSQLSSWCKENMRNDYTLAHEQLHFDITLLMAKKMVVAMRNYKGYTVENFSKKITAIYNDYNKKIAIMQDEYDEETNHSINIKEQQEWILKIKNEMKAADKAFNR